MAQESFCGWYKANGDLPGREIAERICYVGCVHEVTGEFQTRMDRLKKMKPDRVIFCGDVTGSPELELLKLLFYNHVLNRARQEMLIGTEREVFISDANLLNYVGKRPPYPRCTMRMGYLDLMHFLFQLEGDSVDEAETRIRNLKDHDIACGIRKLARENIYFNEWAKKLSRGVKLAIFERFESNAHRFLSIVNDLTNYGVKVAIVGGNWDIPQKIKAIAGDGVEVFDNAKFLRSNDVDFADDLSFLSTSCTAHVLIPFGVVSGERQRDDDLLSRIVDWVSSERERNKTVITVVHGEPNLLVHNLVSPDYLLTTRHSLSIVHEVGRLLSAIRPDEVVYGHQHNRLVDCEGRLLDKNAKYLLQAQGEDVELVSDSSQFGRDGQIVATYLPYQYCGCVEVPRGSNGVLTLFGGKRNPVRVLNI